MINIKEEDFEFRTWRKQPGGQQVGVDSSVIVIHKPSGIAVIMDERRSLMQNKSMGVAKLTDILIRAGILTCSCVDETS